MYKPISTKTHAILDYASVPALLLLPRTLKWGRKTTNLLTGTALGLLGTSLITKYELSIFKLLPIKAHLALDMLSGALLAGAPFALLKKRERTGLITGLLLGLGIFEIAAANLTQTHTSLEEKSHTAQRSFIPTFTPTFDNNSQNRPERTSVGDTIHPFFIK